ncbi:MAG: SDR family oxidoreductase [Chitinophagaceae bacterium]|jgi:short-subunit dehydrogenase|nr:SDR family oxidoreductase [Chitinophagaceae bacterium]
MNVVITGASQGIGKAIAEKYAAEGHNLLLCSKNEKRLLRAAQDISKKNIEVNILTYPADLSDKEQVKAFAKWILKKNILIDILVNNAGNFLPGSIYNEEEGVLEKMIEINLYSAYHLTRALLPEMMKNKNGHIFNVCSIAALKAYPNGGSYSISKYALMGFSKNLREEMKSYDIKVTTVYPGAVYTSSWKASGVDPKRIMETKDIADTIYSISKLSPQACVEDIVLRPQLGDLP